MKKYLTIAFYAIVSMFLFSCEKEKEIQSPLFLMESEEGSTLADFAAILSATVYNEPDVRSFLKEEALKTIDKDYDVFYPWVKNTLVRDGLSFRDILMAYDPEGKLPDIEQALPLLTILVPDWSWVDENCFSAPTWDISNRNVAVTYEGPGDLIPLYGKGKLLGSIQSSQFPSDPVLIVKQNERIEFNPTKGGENPYQFVDPEFDGMSMPETKGYFTEQTYYFYQPQPSNEVNTSDITSRVVQSYTEANNAYNMPQRDYIYYYMTATRDTGFVDFHYAERIHKFRFTSGQVPGLYDDTEAGHDIKLEYSENPGQEFTNTQIKELAWNDGYLEIKFNIIAGSMTDTHYKSIPFKDAFVPSQVRHEKYTNIFGAVTWRYYLAERANLVPKWITIDRNLFSWDLKNYPFAYYINVEEVDSGATITKTLSNTYEYATNFTYSSQTNTDNMKYEYGSGSSTKTTQQWTKTITSKNDNDDLGSFWVHYTDPIITQDYVSQVQIYNYSTGYVDVLIIPTKLY